MVDAALDAMVALALEAAKPPGPARAAHRQDRPRGAAAADGPVTSLTSRRPGRGPSTCGPAARTPGRPGVRAADRRRRDRPAGWTCPAPPSWSWSGGWRRPPATARPGAGVPPGSPTWCSAGPAPAAACAQQPLSWPAPARRAAPVRRPAGRPRRRPGRRAGAASAVGALTELLLRRPDGTRAARRRATPAAHPDARRSGSRVRRSPRPSYAARWRPPATSRAAARRACVLLAEPLDAALAQVWSARVQRGAPVRWPGFVERWAGRRDLPPSADLPALARLWAERVGPDRVHVVRRAGRPGDGDPRPPPGPRRSTRADAAARARAPRWRDLSPAGRGRRAPGQRGAQRAVRPATPARGWWPEPGPRAGRRRRAAGTALTVPDAVPGLGRGARPSRLAEDLRAGGYPVHGDLDGLVPPVRGRPRAPAAVDVLDVAAGRLPRRAVPRDQQAQEPRSSDPEPSPPTAPGAAARRHARRPARRTSRTCCSATASRWPSRASSTPPTGSTRTSWPRST